MARRWPWKCVRRAMDRSSPTCCRTRALFEPGHVVALAWTALAEDDTTAQALLELNRARDWPGFVAAAQDVVGADAEHLLRRYPGHIGLIAPGRVPIRRSGRRPLAGAGLERRVRLAGLDPVRGAAARLRPAGRPPAQRQQPPRARGLSLPADRGLGAALSRAAARRAARRRRTTSSRISPRSRPISCRCSPTTCCRSCSRPRPRAPRRPRPGRRSRHGTG